MLEYCCVEDRRPVRKPNSRELNVLNHFVGDCIEAPGAFSGAGKNTFDEMIKMGWIVWVDAPETGEFGYQITAAGVEARS
jgi:hypothetical protein